MNNKSRLERFLDFGGENNVAREIRAASKREICEILTKLRGFLHVESLNSAILQKTMHEMEPSRSFLLMFFYI
jgi:hypothetical protein